MTIKQLLGQTKNKLAPEELDLVLALALHKSKEYLYKNPDKELNRAQIRAFDKYLQLRLRHWPLAYLQGYKNFYGLKFLVNKNTLVPRPETEILVDQALNFLKNKKHQNLPRKGDNPIRGILEVGTGSGCIIVAVAKNAVGHNYLAGDISAAALKIAQTNARKNGLQNSIKFVKSDLLAKIPEQKFNLVLANLPYLTNKQMAEPSIRQEPRLALLAGKDGLKYYEKFFIQVKNYLADDYQILIEIDPGQTEKIKEIIKNNLSKSNIEIIKDLAGMDRVVKISN